MAHLIDNSKGFNAFVSYAKPALHGLGSIFIERLNTLQALEHSGCNFDVLKLPNIHSLPNGIELISEESFFTVRTDVNNVLGSRLGKDYTVLQNIEAFNLVDEILNAGTATIETAGAIDEGRKVFICLKANKDIIVDGSDVVKQYILITNSHDGSLALTVMSTNVRVVCNNTLSAALRVGGKSDKIRIRHTANAADRMKEAVKVLDLIKDNTEINTANYEAMKANIVSKEQMLDYFGNIFFNAEEVAKLQRGVKMQNFISTRKQNILIDVLNFANRGTGQVEALNNGNINMWSSYNAITGYLTRKKYETANDRANSLLFGTDASRIEEAGVLALTPTKIKPLRKIATDFNLN